MKIMFKITEDHELFEYRKTQKSCNIKMSTDIVVIDIAVNRGQNMKICITTVVGLGFWPQSSLVGNTENRISHCKKINVVL